MVSFGFEVKGRDGGARRGTLTTRAGTMETPLFMPVGTAGAFKGLYGRQVYETGARAALANTYHLMLRPGVEAVAMLGGIGRMMKWGGSVLTDSGGYQVMSLAKLRKVEEGGVKFRSHVDGREMELTPEGSVEAQGKMGSDMRTALDELASLVEGGSREASARAMERTTRWALRSLRAFEEGGGREEGAGMFGIVQGGMWDDLRERSADALTGMDFDGYAIGGLAVGESREEIVRVLGLTAGLLPEDKPRYAMGLGTPRDVVEAIGMGADMFDCVLPTRMGRHGRAYVGKGETLDLRRSCYAGDKEPLEEGGACEASGYERGYVHHLLRSGEMLGGMLLSWHNVAYYGRLTAEARAAIEEGRYGVYARGFEASGNNGTGGKEGGDMV